MIVRFWDWRDLTQFKNPRATEGSMVSKSHRSRRSQRLTYLQYATNTATTTQLFKTRVKMEYLSNEPFKWLQDDTESSVNCVRKVKQASPSAARCILGFTYQTEIYAPLHQRISTCFKTSSTPLSQKLRLKEAEQKQRPQTILWNFGINGKDHVSKNSRWHYRKPFHLHCSNHNLKGVGKTRNKTKQNETKAMPTIIASLRISAHVWSL